MPQPPMQRPLAAFPFLLAALAAQQPAVYRSPPEPIASLVTAEPTPDVSLSPCRRWLLFVHREALPDIAVLARPHKKLAGLRIDAATQGPQLGVLTTKLVLRSLADNKDTELPVPGGHLGALLWSADGERLAIARTTDAGTELWVVAVAARTARRVDKVQ